MILVFDLNFEANWCGAEGRKKIAELANLVAAVEGVKGAVKFNFLFVSTPIFLLK